LIICPIGPIKMWNHLWIVQWSWTTREEKTPNWRN